MILIVLSVNHIISFQGGFDMAKYFIISNSGLLFESEFENDDDACNHLKRYFHSYVTSILASNNIDLYDKYKNCLLSINAASGKVVRDWRL